MRLFLVIAALVSAQAAAAAPDAAGDAAEADQALLGPTPNVAPPARPALAPPNASASKVARHTEERAPILGLTIDGGFPDGFALSALLRPVRPLRLDAGVTYNIIGFGVRGGLTFIPFRSAIAPVLRGEYGHTFDGDATGLVGHFSTLTDAERILLRNVSYDYASLQLGLEFGASDRFVFFARGGVAWFWTTVQNFQRAAQAAQGGGQTVSEAADPHVRGTVPTATLGVLFYFW